MAIATKDLHKKIFHDVWPLFETKNLKVNGSQMSCQYYVTTARAGM
jgi:hypothetical protein